MQDDFDLEKSNATFNKEELMAEIEQQRAKLRAERDTDAAPEERVAYDPSVSIFDTISSEVLEKHAAAEDGSGRQRSRDDAHKERRVNQETFGESPNFNFGRGRGGRGGRARGGPQQRLQNVQPHNPDPNQRSRQHPQQPQRQNRPAPKSNQ